MKEPIRLPRPLGRKRCLEVGADGSVVVAEEVRLNVRLGGFDDVSEVLAAFALGLDDGRNLREGLNLEDDPRVGASVVVEEVVAAVSEELLLLEDPRPLEGRRERSELPPRRDEPVCLVLDLSGEALRASVLGVVVGVGVGLGRVSVGLRLLFLFGFRRLTSLRFPPGVLDVVVGFSVGTSVTGASTSLVTSSTVSFSLSATSPFTVSVAAGLSCASMLS